VSLFAPTATVAQISPSTPVPSPASGPLPRFAGDHVRWMAVSNSANICAFARCAVRVFSGSMNGIPGNDAAAWTLLELSPLPGFAVKALLALPGGLPIQYVLLAAPATTTATDNSVAAIRTTIASAGAGADSVWFGVAFQDRVVRADRCGTCGGGSRRVRMEHIREQPR